MAFGHPAAPHSGEPKEITVIKLRWFLPLLILASPFSFAQEQPAGEEKRITAEEFLASLKFQQGKITLPNNVATLNIPKTFRYLAPDDTERVLTMAWGNPSGSGTLGMIFPSDAGPLDENGWGVVLTYDDSGYVSDKDADEIDYKELLSGMQEESQADNEERAKLGYSTVDLVGWAEQPAYDSSTHKMYWAKELRFEGNDFNTLNYNVRVLGRSGVLVLNAVAGMNQLGQVKNSMKDVTAFTNFLPGHRYEDFDASTDRVAEYGIAALIGGAAAAKIGLFAKIGALLIAAKKFLIIGLIAVVAVITSLVRKKKKPQTNPAE